MLTNKMLQIGSGQFDRRQRYRNWEIGGLGNWEIDHWFGRC